MKNKHYLVVDDDHCIIEVCQEMQMTCVYDAAAGHEVLETGAVELAFLDIQGIERDGKDVRTLVEMCKAFGIPFFVTSANPLECARLQADDPSVRLCHKEDIFKKVRAGE